MSEPQRALISTISAGQEAIESAQGLLNEKAKLPPLGQDPASVKWKETQWNTNQQAVHSQVSAMNAATAQMVTLTGQDSTDHNAVGAAVNTISTNLPDMAREVKMLAALMDDKSLEGDDLMGAAKTLCGAFSDMLSSAAPQTTEVSVLTVLSENQWFRVTAGSGQVVQRVYLYILLAWPGLAWPGVQLKIFLVVFGPEILIKLPDN